MKNINESVSEAPIEEFNNYLRLVNRHEKVVSNVIVNGIEVYKDSDFVAGYGKDFRSGKFKRRIIK